MAYVHNSVNAGLTIFCRLNSIRLFRPAIKFHQTFLFSSAVLMSANPIPEYRMLAYDRLKKWLATNSQLPLKYADKSIHSSMKFDHISYDPATGYPLVTFNNATQSELNNIIQDASVAQTQWIALPLLERAKLFRKLAERVRSEADWLAELETLDTGKPIWESRADILSCADSFELFGGFIPSLIGTHVPVPPNPGSFYYTRREPYGICGGIGAWNFPFQMAVWKSAPALAAGNAMIFKPSPLTPLTGIRLAELYNQSGFPPNLFSVILGDAEIGQALVQHPSVAKVSFTGSVSGGRAVLQAASRRIIPTTLELGGKSALIIMPDADLDEAVKGTLMANFYTQGEVCSNAARVFVQKSIRSQFEHKLVKSIKKLRVGDPLNETTSVGALISPDHADKVKDYLNSAVSEGATVLIGGSQPIFEQEYLNNGNFMMPCVLTNCHDEMMAVKEEIFGPILTILEFESEDEAVYRSNKSDLGLAGGVFTQSLAVAHRIASKLQCGSVYVNSYNAYPPGIPFGGYKASGFGRENSMDTLYAYTQIKAVYVEGGKLLDPFPSID